MVNIEQGSDALLLFRLSSSFQQPGRLIQQNVFHILVFLQLAEESFFCPTRQTPVVEHRFNARLAIGNIARQTVGIESGCPGNGIIGYGLAQYRQGLYGIPCRITCKFHRQATVGCRTAVTVEQAVQRESTRFFTTDRHGKRLRYILLIA